MFFYINLKMEFFETYDIFAEIAFYLRECDLHILMTVCKKIRKCVGRSDVWRVIDPEVRLYDIPDIVDGKKVFEIFKSMKICKTRFAMQNYYGNYYYLYVLKRWISCSDGDFWSIYSLMNNIEDINKLRKISCFICDSNKSAVYWKWGWLISELARRLNLIKHDDRDKILKRIYINGSCYSNNGSYWQIFITDTNIKYTSFYECESNMAFYNPNITINPGKFHYTLEYSVDPAYDEISYTICKNNDSEISFTNRSFSKKINKIAAEMNVSSEIFAEIIRSIFS